MTNNAPHLAVILGPTASGKTQLACQLAAKIKAEIISADSRQVYQGMDIGTGKDLDEYQLDGHAIPYHLIDIHPAGYKYNIAAFQLDFYRVLQEIHSRDMNSILCGGSGLYIETALKGNSFLGIPQDKVLYAELEDKATDELQKMFAKLSDSVKSQLSNKTRRQLMRAIIIDKYISENPEFAPVDIPAFTYTLFGVQIDRNLRRSKITARLSYRMNNGLIEEVEQLLAGGLNHQDLDYYGLEYKWVGMYLRNEITKKELFEGLKTAIHQFSKRQMTWFRRMEKNGFNIHWIDSNNSAIENLKEMIAIYQSEKPLKTN